MKPIFSSLFSAPPLLALAIVACSGNVQERIPYYAQEGRVEISGISTASEEGNVGGKTVTITGSGFGNDPNKVMVRFGSVNAEVLSVSESEIAVRTPRGPLEGGLIDVRVGTPEGLALAEGLYTYDVGEFYADQIGYVLVGNYWNTCYGGDSPEFSNLGCDELVFIGETGTDGSSELLNFRFPRLHTQSVGFYGGTDVAYEWTLEVPGQIAFVSDQLLDNLRIPFADAFQLYNPIFELAEEEGILDALCLEGSGEVVGPTGDVETSCYTCVDLTNFGSWVYGGNGGTPASALGLSSILPQPVDAADVEECEQGLSEVAPNTRLYDKARLSFCEVDAFQENRTGRYQTEWPILDDFFVGPVYGNNGSLRRLGSGQAVTVNLQAPELSPDLANLPLSLPEPVVFEAIQGLDEEVGEDDFDLWSILGLQTCFSGDNRGELRLDETAVRFVWTPSAFTPSEVAGPILETQTYVRFTMTYLTIGWFGGESYPVRATIQVPDTYNVDPETGKSTLDIPVSVFYQFPNINANWQGGGGLGGVSVTWGDPLEGVTGYLVTTADRVTEYRLDLSGTEVEGVPDGANIVFAYQTGDFQFIGWDNPLLQAGECGDCADGDNDGWVDALDPDCLDPDSNSLDKARTERGLSRDPDQTCNDGDDNDGDGDIDAADTDCEDGTNFETNCADGIDNDGDGWQDLLDGECRNADGSFNTTGIELGLEDPSWGCSGGLDEDGDGWVDAADPDCETGRDSEVGFSGTACNDGLDNDAHGDVDTEDPYCISAGADSLSETPSYLGDCRDTQDNDGDGYVDGLDPDCENEALGYDAESRLFDTSATARACYNNQDDDGDTLVDADDPGCWNPAYGNLPDGFLDDEGADNL